MIPHKEELSFIEDLAKGQHRIYSDSCDEGRYLTESQLNELRRCVKALKKFYGGKNWECNTHKMKQGAVNNIRIPFEIEGERARGVRVDVNVVKRKPGKIYTTIKINRFDLDVSDVPACNR